MHIIPRKLSNESVVECKSWLAPPFQHWILQHHAVVSKDDNERTIVPSKLDKYKSNK